MRKEIKIIIGAAASIFLVAALYVFYTFDPNTQPFFPRCPFLMVTGYECPGCGSQRAIHSLLHLNIGAALKYNAFILLSIPYLMAGIGLEYFGLKKRFPRAEKILFGRWAALVVLVITIAFWILRNV